MSSRSIKITEFLAITIIIAVFIGASIVSKTYENQFKDLIQLPGAVGMAIYVFLAVISNVIAPLTVFPLLPVVVALWGSFSTAILSILGWTIGASAIFYLTRRYGRPFASKFVNLEKAKEISKAIPQKHFFWIIVLFRVIFPVDILSFAIGLFTHMEWQPYILATVIGITPFAFLLAYGVTLPITYQIIIAAVLLAAFAYLYTRSIDHIKNWFKK